MGCQRHRPARSVSAFANSDWLDTAGFRHFDLIENSPGRYACQFDSPTDPLLHLRQVSRQKPGLIFLLDYERQRVKGLAKLQNGRITRHEITY
jgi:hypothetical protein